VTEIHEPHGPLHTGEGGQYLGPTVVVNHVESVTRQGWDLRWMAKDDLRRLRQQFVPPPNLGPARDKLHQNRTIILIGPPGSGRYTAAKMLLAELGDDSAPFSPLLDEADRASDKLNPVRIGFQDRLLLDLSDSDEETLRERQRELPTFRAELHRQDAYLVVVLADERDHHVNTELAHHVVKIDRPRGHIVFQRHLAIENIRLADDDLQSEALAPHLTSAMGDIANLARRVIQQRDADPRGYVSTWLKQALAEDSSRQHEVAEQVNATSSARERAVLLAAAMCEGATTDGVFFAAQWLLEQVNTSDEKPRLEQPGYLRQLKELVKEVQTNERVAFAKVAYDDAVRNHFWDNYPDLRSAFSRWVGETLTSSHLTPSDRKALVQRFLDQALRTASVQDVVSLINRWVNPTEHGGPSYWIEFATQALIAGLTHERHGRHFRNLVYDWSRKADLPEHIGQLLVRVCTDVIAPSFPEQAVVRLHQRARRESGQRSPTARDALLDLVSRSRLLLRLLLDRLARNFGNHNWTADLHLFLEAADPHQLVGADGRSQPLAAEAVAQSQLVEGWHTVMTHRPDLAWPTVRTWLQAATRTKSPDLLLTILVDAAQRNLRLLGALYVVARDWSHSEPGCPRIAAELSRLIDAAQGIHPADFTFHATTEEATR
jgi:hypothetical protein